MAVSETGRLNAWDVVVVPFPYTDRFAEKRRPALVVSSRALAALDLVWLAMITSAENEPWQGDVPIAQLARAGLPFPSVVRPAKIACIDPGRVLRRIGRIDKSAAKMVARRLASFLAAP